ncbi:SAF domain-containing protein [Micromonospora sp. Llam0]|uniref:SAF domain-containing protein n=1 Tax=Micromonospora sp. Llam0 TaxID=2485143 RepID=UPI000FAB9F7B|nr:SAF domain-containing protein [Micromonospora sp. Llam0]ROO62978.1 SAF domain-containing protein [Micromonospora sp. Llam0]
MAVTAVTATPGRSGAASATGTGSEPPRGPVLRRRVSPLRVLLAVLLILGFALAGAVVADRIDTRLPVLATARGINAGQVITEADLTVVRVAADSTVATVSETDRGAVVGRTAAVPLVAGALLSPGQLGAAAWPPAGQALVAVGVKPGRLPSGVTAGSHVLVLIVPSSADVGTGGAAQVVQAEATVWSLEEAKDQSGDMAVSLLIAEVDGRRLAAVVGDVTLVQLGVGR